MFNSLVGTFRYKAFISYSHRDREWSAWLQRALERYRVPRRLVGSPGTFGAIPRRLTPVFRDREDLSSASDLSISVKESLEASEALVVVCSPAAAQSPWVNEEIRFFRSLGRENLIFALIVDGDAAVDIPVEQCFPPALTVNPDGTTREPLAADARKWADGKRLAKLKIIAGILGIRLDALRRRDMQRRQRLWMASAGSAVAIALVMTVLAVVAIGARNAAENRREHAENLVGYMVGDLRTKLGEVGRLDILEGMGGQVSEYLGTLKPEELTDESLTQQTQVWRQLGEVSMDQGDLAEALKAFSTSRDIMAELYRRSPHDTGFLFELGNAEFWIGYVHLETGEFDKAEQAMATYLDHSNRLVEMDPENAKWVMEKAYAHSNMAALIVERAGTDTQGALSHIKAAVELNRRVIKMDPDEPMYQSELATALAWLADTQLMVCNLGDALISRQESVSIAKMQVADYPGNAKFKSIYANALTGVGNVAYQVGLTDLALTNYRQAKAIFGQMSMLEPSNVEHRFGYLTREFFAAVAMAESGHLPEALGNMEVLREPLHQALEAESYKNLRRYINWVTFLLQWSDMKWRTQDQGGAAALLTEAVDNLGRLVLREHDNATFTEQLLAARFLFWQQRGEDLFNTPGFSGVEIRTARQDHSCATQANLVRQAILSGELEQAGKMTNDLLARGYYQPNFIRTCRQYDLCQ